jgi:hypothetical protein
MPLSDRILSRTSRLIRKVGLGQMIGPAIAQFPNRDPVIDNDLSRLVYSHEGRLVHKWDHYLRMYDRHFSRFRGTAFKLLEIGISHGGSLEIWRKYFGPDATIFGIDVNEACRKIDDPPSINVRIGSQADPDFLKSIVAEMGGVDVVIDDGSHRVTHQRASFKFLFPRISPNGIYLIEDLHSNYWRGEFEGGWKRRSTFIEQMKDLIDDLHGFWHKRPQRHKDAHRIIESLSFYDSAIVIEKRPMQTPYCREVGYPSF